MVDGEQVSPGVVCLGSGRRQERGGPEDAYALYDVHGWTVVVAGSLGAPWDGPDEINVRFTEIEAVDSVVDSDGITGEILRAIPLGDARKRIKAIKDEWRREQGHHDAVAARVETDEEWARFAREYVALVKEGQRHPIRHMAAMTGISRNTLSARVRRARERGFLEGPAGKPADRLGARAAEILREEAAQ
ncbi:hypothetical protein [Actinoplanes sp. URMC 104]|uniref:hypothetical protein n=1 Tax=Actinoplanes sp. URMC 104 TaxID=3423409 RepID=UPI003F1E2479